MAFLSCHQVGVSGGQYRGYEQYRGPQYWADKGYTPVPASQLQLADPGLLEKVNSDYKCIVQVSKTKCQAK